MSQPFWTLTHLLPSPVYPLGHASHLVRWEARLQWQCSVQVRVLNTCQILPVTVGSVHTSHSLETRLIGAGDHVDPNASPSVSGETIWTVTALGSAWRLKAINAGIARWIMVARGRRRCWHYGITGITARDTSLLPIFISGLGIFSLSLSFCPPTYVHVKSHARVLPHPYLEKGPSLPAQRAEGKLCNGPACRTYTCKWYVCVYVFLAKRLIPYCENIVCLWFPVK